MLDSLEAEAVMETIRVPQIHRIEFESFACDA
jgi:hypothetical protein